MREIKANLHYLIMCILEYECNYVASWVFQFAAQYVNKEIAIIRLYNI
jgi:hypothetical protein